VIAIADQQGELIALVRLDGAPYPSILIAVNKAWTAARERKPSMEIGRASRARNSGFDIGSFGIPVTPRLAANFRFSRTARSSAQSPSVA
jgi:glc operon protein GlcG